MTSEGGKPESERGIPHAELHVDEGSIVARVRIHGHYHPSVDYQHIIKLMDDYHIVYGADVSAIQRLVERFRTSKGEVTLEEIVAQGVAPTPGVDGKIEILVKAPPPVTIQEDGRADFRNINRFQAVESGAILAKRTPAVQGKPGTNIRGESVLPAKPIEPELSIGENVKLDTQKNEYVAQKHGVFVHEGDRIAVSPVLDIPGNVGLASGNVSYEGNLRITGNIERGSKVEAAGDAEVAGMIESADINVRGSLTVHKGINTRKEGQLVVGGHLKSVYVENSKISVDGHISLEKSLIGSDVLGLGDLFLSGRGSAISGGEIRLFGSVAADIIGNRSNIPTHLIIGVHHKNQHYFDMTDEELEPVQRDFERRANEIRQIQALIQRSRGKIPIEKQAQIREAYKEYRLAIEQKDRLQHLIQSLRETRYNREEVRIIAREVLLPGVVIHYREHVEKITAPQSRCILRFRPGMEKPVIEAFKG